MKFGTKEAVLCLTAFTYAELSPDCSTKVLLKAVELNVFEDNVVVSPYSLLGPLGALVLASGYSTRREILDALGLANKSEVLALYDEYQEILSNLDGVQLNTSNKIYVALNETINHRFNEVAKKHFNLTVENLDFNQTEESGHEIANLINAHANDIRNWEQETPPTLKSVLVSGVFLKSPWFTNFNYAVENEFFIKPNISARVGYLTSNSMYKHGYSEELKSELIAVPLHDLKCEYVVVLPKAPYFVDTVLDALEADSNVVNKALKNLTLDLLNLTMPFFLVKTTTDLKEVLQELNVSRIFEDDAQIRRLLKNNSDLHLSEALQEALLAVDLEEIGGSAANRVEVAPTVKTYSAGIIPPPALKINVNRSFYFEVRCSQIILFSGVIRYPTTPFQ